MARHRNHPAEYDGDALGVWPHADAEHLGHDGQARNRQPAHAGHVHAPLKSRRSVASLVFHGPVRDVATVKIDRWKRPISNAGAPPLTARNRRQHVKKADRTQQI